MVNRHRPIVPGHVPIELVVVLEEASAVAHGVGDLNRARRVCGTGYEDFQVTQPVRSGRLIFQLGALTVGHAGNIQKQSVVCAPRPRIFDGDETVYPMPLAFKRHHDAFVDNRRAIFRDGNGVVVVRDPPAPGKEW
jgi:hypothetical protein